MADFLLSVGVDVVLSYDQMQKDISNLVSQLNSNPPKIKVGLDIDNTAIANFRTQVDEITKTLGGLGGVGTTSAAAASASSAAASMADLAAKTREAAGAATQVKTLQVGTLEYHNALRQVNTLLTQVTHSQEIWTAAKNGKTSTAYNDLDVYRISLESLINDLNRGALTADDFKQRLGEIKSGVSTASATIRNAGEATKTWGQRIGTLSAKFGTWFSITRVIMAAYRAVRQMVSNVIELDTAMTELKKVTNETDATYEKFLNNATKRAKDLGAALSDTVSATSDFARLGYGIEDAEKLADAAIVYKNVGDGIEDINTASESIIATMQAFSIPAENVMGIVDRFNEVGNNFAISSKGVGDALLRSAAALHSANNTLDESIALAAAANTIVQDPEKVGTTLKTVSMYLRAAKTEAEDAGEATDGMANSMSELRDEILSLTGNKVDIQLDENTFKSTYQILKELSVVWRELSDISQANILEMVGGKRNANVVSALLENFSVAERALKTSASSSGSALAENEKVLESIQGKLNIMKATFEEFSQNLIEGSFVKDIVVLGTGLLEVLNGVTKVIDALGGLNNVLFITMGIIATIKADALVALIGTKLPSKIIGLGKSILSLGTTFSTAFTTARAAGATSLQSISAGFKAVTASASAAQIAVAAFVAIIAVINIVSSAMENARQEAIRLSDEEVASQKAIVDKTKALEDAYATYKKYADMSELTSSQETEFNSALETITKSIGDKTEALAGLTQGTKDYADALDGAIQKELKEAELAAKKEKDAARKSVLSTAWSDWDGSKINATYGNSATDNKEEKELVKKIMGDKFLGSKYYAAGGGMGATDYFTTVKDFDDADLIVEYFYKLQELQNALAEKDMFDGKSYDNVTKSINTLKPVVEAYVEATADFASANYKATSGLPETVEEYNAYSSAVQKALKDTFNISDEEVSEITDAYLSAEGFAETIKSLDTSAVETIVSKTAQLENTNKSLAKAFEQLDKIYADVYDKEDFDYSSILNNEDFAKAFGNLDEYEEFIDTITKSPSNISACQEAFNNLSNAYLKNSNVLSGVTDETRDATVAMLKQMGISNAAAIVDAHLAYNKEYLKYTTGEYTDMTYDEILALYNECAAGTTTQQVLAQLAADKLAVNKSAISTSSDIDQLISLANSANATAATLQNLAKAKQYLAMSETYSEKAGKTSGRSKQFNQTNAERYAKMAEELLSEPLEYDKIDPNDFKVNYTGGPTSTGAKSKSKGDTWFEKQYKEHQHMVAMGQETEADYLRWLESAYKKAYQEKIIELDDYYKYEEEVFEGSKSLLDNYLGDAEHSIEMLGHTQGNEQAIVSEYKNMQDAVHKVAEYYRSLGLREDSDQIQELQKLWWEYEDNIRETSVKVYEDIVSAGENAISLHEIWMGNATNEGNYNAVREHSSAIVSEYKNMQDAVHQQAEYYRSKGYSETSEEIKKLQKLWWDYEDAITDVAVNSFKALSDNANDALSDIQSVYDKLKDAAKAYADSGFLSVSTMQDILSLGVEYIALLQDENGQLVINEENIHRVIKARTQQLGIETSLAYIESLRAALTNNETEALNNLLSVTDSVSKSTWDLVYAQLASLDLSDSQYYSAKQRIDAIRSMADEATLSVGKTSNTIIDGLNSSAEAMEQILQYTIEMIKQETEDRIEGLEKEIESYKKIVDLQKESLDNTQKQNDYNKTVSDKLKDISKIQSKINQLSMDDSREAQAEKKALEEELSQLQTDLADYQTDYSVDKQKEMLDDMAEAYEDEKNAEIEMERDKISSYEKLYKLATERIENLQENLLDQLLDYNAEYGNDLSSTLIEAWELAYAKFKEFDWSYGVAVDSVQGAIDASENGTHTTVSGSDTYVDSRAIRNQMKSNSLRWFTASDAEQKRLSSANADLAKQLSLTYKDGAWYAQGESTPFYTVGKWEAVDYITKAMKANSAKWHGASESERATLAQANERMAKYIADLTGEKVWKDDAGAWWIGNAKLYDSYGTYHTGGVVGDSTLKKDEVMAILKDGELVLDEKREEGLYKLVDFAQILSERLGTTIDTSKFDNLFGGFSLLPTSRDLLPAAHAGSTLTEFSPHIEVNISHNGSMSDDDARRYGGLIAETALGELKDAFTKKGITNIGSSALK